MKIVTLMPTALYLINVNIFDTAMTSFKSFSVPYLTNINIFDADFFSFNSLFLCILGFKLNVISSDLSSNLIFIQLHSILINLFLSK